MGIENNVKNDNLKYCFIRVIGEGAFSRVYLVEGRNGQRYACKVSKEVKMLRREAEIMNRLHHPLFPVYMNYEEREGVGRLFMEYIFGRSLGQLVRFRGGVSAKQTMRIAEELADGMRYLHERQPVILYRDLKPDNIIVCEDGHIKLIDFGCACYQDTQTGVKVGTPGFAPPEQLDTGGVSGIYSDVYGLGRTVYGMLTGETVGCGERRTGSGGERKNCREEGTGSGGERKNCREEGSGSGGERKNCRRKGRGNGREERRCRQKLEYMIKVTTREDFRQRPQDMVSVLYILTGKRKNEEEIFCEKNIWESSYKNSCSLPSI